ncbi:MAG TPA: NUDIX domain-containing protein [Candidatus Nanoarchaeia archaeon]|nr:NUDIX domain-containing protein [Candidatus Nanoarchaeia archaeon]
METAAGMVLFREKANSREYLILKYNTADHYWGLAKGRLEPGETEEQAAFREVGEETGLKKIKLMEEFKEQTKYFFKHNGEVLSKEVTWFLGRVNDDQDGLVSHEHEELKWLRYEEAVKLLSFKEYKKLLEKAEKRLGGRKRGSN